MIHPELLHPFFSYLPLSALSSFFLLVGTPSSRKLLVVLVAFCATVSSLNIEYELVYHNPPISIHTLALEEDRQE